MFVFWSLREKGELYHRLKLPPQHAFQFLLLCQHPPHLLISGILSVSTVGKMNRGNRAITLILMPLKLSRSKCKGFINDLKFQILVRSEKHQTKKKDKNVFLSKFIPPTVARDACLIKECGPAV